MTELTLPFRPPFQGRQMPVTERDSIEMEKPEWLIQMETALEMLNEGVVIAATPWFVAPGTPKNAHLSMVYSGFRYVLPSTAGTLLRVPGLVRLEQ
jgi:hypothetical protein